MLVAEKRMRGSLPNSGWSYSWGDFRYEVQCLGLSISFKLLFKDLIVHIFQSPTSGPPFIHHLLDLSTSGVLSSLPPGRLYAVQQVF